MIFRASRWAMAGFAGMGTVPTLERESSSCRVSAFGSERHRRSTSSGTAPAAGRTADSGASVRSRAMRSMRQCSVKSGFATATLRPNECSETTLATPRKELTATACPSNGLHSEPSYLRRANQLSGRRTSGATATCSARTSGHHLVRRLHIQEAEAAALCRPTARMSNRFGETSARATHGRARTGSPPAPLLPHACP